MNRVVLKGSVLSVALFSYMISFGMCELTVCKKQPQEFHFNNSYTVDNQHQAALPVELVQKTATHADSKVKNRLQQTCRLYNSSCSKYNPAFISSFKVNEEDAHDIMCAAAWWNNSPLEAALRKHYDINKIKVTIIQASEVNKFSMALYIPVGIMKTLRNKYNNSDKNQKVVWDVEYALYCSVKCNDCKTVGNISQKMNRYTCTIPNMYTVPCKIDLHKSLLMSIIQQNRDEMFELIVKNDPFNAKNCYCYASEAVHYGPFLDFLKRSKDISPDLKKKYVHIYRECDGKTFKQLQRKKYNNQLCVIS